MTPAPLTPAEVRAANRPNAGPRLTPAAILKAKTEIPHVGNGDELDRSELGRRAALGLALENHHARAARVNTVRRRAIRRPCLF